MVSVQGEVARPTRLGRYELITRIGQGGMAEVQLALQRGPAGFEKLVVVKLVHDNLATQKAFVDMLLDEARVAALVKHPNVVDIYDLGQADGRYFIAMEYLEGEPLLAVLRAGREGKRLDPLSTGRLIADTAEGLDAAHELRSMSGERIELVHHDISLGNIVVLYNGQVKLVDFGVAKATQTSVGKAKVQGKFSYMAPEKLKGAPGDRRSDIFSLGCVFWEALTLKRLFRGNTDAETMKQVLEMTIQPPSRINKDIPREYDAIVMRTLERDPAKRHQTAKELAVEIEELLRQSGYGAKNDKVARYMQEVFRPHIDARKKLVQEVVAKGSASAQIVADAFNDAQAAAGSNVTPAGVDARYRITPAGGIPIVAVPTFADSDISRPTEISKSPFAVDTDASAPPIMPPELVTNVSRQVVHGGIRGILLDPRKRLFALGGAGAGLIVLIAAVMLLGGSGKASSGGNPTQRVAADVRSGSGSETGDRQQATGDRQLVNETGSAAVAGSGSAAVAAAGSAAVAAAGSAAEAGSGSGSDDEIVMDPKQKHPKHPTVAIAPPPPADGEALWKQGVQAYVKGDLKNAITLLNRAKAAKPGMPQIWLTLGKAYEKSGDMKQAKTAYLRYLSLQPNGPEAPGIRQRFNLP